MWDLDNRTPFPAHARFDRDGDGCAWWCVFVKLTAEWRPDALCRTAPRQQPIWMAPRLAGDAAAPVLLADGDLCLAKGGTDVLLHGRVPAPSAAEGSRRVGLAVGAWRKEAEAHPARAWDDDLRPRALDEAGEVDLGWTSAYGGACPAAAPDDPARVFADNPVGIGYATSAAGARGRRLPALTAPGAYPASWQDRPVPTAFGPVPAEWPARRRLGGTYDGAWAARKAPYLPDDFDEAFHRCAPADQQMPGHLTGGEAIELHGIPLAGRPGPARTVVPAVAWRVETRFRGAWTDVPMTLSTLHLFPGTALVTLLWQGRLRVGANQNDVLVGETRVALAGARGVVMHPDHVDAL